MKNVYLTLTLIFGLMFLAFNFSVIYNPRLLEIAENSVVANMFLILTEIVLGIILIMSIDRLTEKEK